MFGYSFEMELLSGKAASGHISGILHSKYQVHGSSVHLTVRKVSCIDPIGQVDFGGGEYIAAGRTELAPRQLRPEDNYLWWDMERAGYYIECNEALHLAADEIALIEPEDRLLRAGGWHVPLIVRGHVEPVELLIEVIATRLRVKQNARIARVRVFRIAAMKSDGSRKSNPKKPKPARGKK